MQNLNESFETLKRINSVIQQRNAYMQDEVARLTTIKNVLTLEYALAVDENIALKERVIELEQMLGAISDQHETELKNLESQIKLWIDNYNDAEENVRTIATKRHIELKLLVAIIKGEI